MSRLGSAPTAGRGAPLPCRRIDTSTSRSDRREAGCRALALLQTVSLQLVLEGANADLKERGRLRPVTANLLERPEDMTPRHLPQRQAGLEQTRQSGTRRGAADAREVAAEELSLGECVALREHNSLLDDVFELADVARPGQRNHALEG